MEVQSAEDAVWRRQHIKDWNGYYEYDKEEKVGYLVIDGQRIPANVFIGCDPATDIDTKDSDFSVIMVIAIDTDNNLYALEYERHRSIQTIGAKDSNGKPLEKKGVVDYLIDLYDK